jgi:hypothetical protein
METAMLQIKATHPISDGNGNPEGIFIETVPEPDRGNSRLGHFRLEFQSSEEDPLSFIRFCEEQGYPMPEPGEYLPNWALRVGLIP